MVVLANDDAVTLLKLVDFAINGPTTSIRMQNFGEVILDCEVGQMRGVDLVDVLSEGGEYSTGLHSDAQFVIQFADLHSRSFIEMVDVLRVHTLLVWPILLPSGIALGAVYVIV